MKHIFILYKVFKDGCDVKHLKKYKHLGCYMETFFFQTY